MSVVAEDLLKAAEQLLAPSATSAGVRRAISTAYYGLFHFLTSDATGRMLGLSDGLAAQKHVLARSFTHSGIRSVMLRLRGASADPSVADLLRDAAQEAGSVAVPEFARRMATVFVQAHTDREDADYNWNAAVSEQDARELVAEVRAAIAAWNAANGEADCALKQALAVLMLLRGQVRREA